MYNMTFLRKSIFEPPAHLVKRKITRWLKIPDRSGLMFNGLYFCLEPCKLGCFIAGTGHGYDFGSVEDGTNCDQLDESVVADKCINGECKVCIFLLFCGVCNAFKLEADSETHSNLNIHFIPQKIWNHIQLNHWKIWLFISAWDC